MNWSHQFNCTFDLKTLCAPDNPLSEAVPRGAPSSTASSRQERAIGESLILLCKSQEATLSSSPPRSIPVSTQWLPAEEEELVCQHKWKWQSWLLPFDSKGPLQAPNWMLTARHLSQNHLRPFPKECKRHINGKVLRSSSEALWEKQTLNQTLDHGSQFLGFLWPRACYLISLSLRFLSVKCG